MAISVFGLLILVMVCVGLVLALIKAPKATLAVLGAIVFVAVPLLFYLRFQREPTAQSRSSVNSNTLAQIRATPQARSAIIVTLDQPTTAPSTQPSGKSWVDDWEKFVNTSARNQRWMRAGTTSPWGSEEEARREARQQAAVVLQSYVTNQVRTTSRLVIGTRVVSTNEWVLEQLRLSLMENQFVSDEYIERTQHPYGDTWTCQLLLDASPQTVSRAASNYSRAAQRQLETSAVTWGGLAALGLVIVLLYAFLNSVTKGYFMWRLRAAAAMIVIVALLVVMSMA